MKQTKAGAAGPVVKSERIHAVSMKPLQHIPGDAPEDDQVFACFVDTRGVEHRLPCSLQVARRIEGGKPKGPKSYDGLDAKLDKDFVIHIEDINQVRTVVGIDQFPRLELRRFGSKDDEDGNSDVTLTINRMTNDIDVNAAPNGMPVASLLRILQKIHSIEKLEVGQVLPSDYVVGDISGNKVTLELQ